ncbi:MAG: alpha/beta hydrolase [Pseudomonadales bacterium]|nr:alpha/beta hydrolase [Pseudomonadales bacterium]
MKAKITLVFISLVILFGGVTYYQYINEDDSAVLAARENLAAVMLESEIGSTRYQIFGEHNTATVVLVHSFNGYIETWNANIDALVNAGYRVVAYDLFGRGLSDRPWTEYNLELFRDQLDSLIKHIGAKDVHIIGSSFGCVIATDYALHHPENVQSLSLIGPAGWPASEGRNAALDTPVLGELIFHYFGKQLIRPTVEGYFIDQEKYSSAVEQWDRFASYPGFTRAALSILRHSPVMDYSDGWRQLGKLNKPVVFIWGKQDISFPFSHSEKLPELVPHATLIGIDGAAHWVNIEKATVVNQALISFLNTHTGQANWQ